MKQLISSVIVLLAAIIALPAGAATLPDGEAAIQFKSKRGARSTESTRYVQVYLKSAVAGKTFYMAIDEDTVVEYSMVKAATLYNKKITVDKEEVTVRIWGDSISFINFNTMDAYDVVIGEDGKNTITELRCQNDSITSLDFINDMKALTYIYVGNNKCLKEININSDVLERCVLNDQPSVESITVEGANIYEFDFTDTELNQTVDLSKCPKLQKITMTKSYALKNFTLGTHDELTSISLNYAQIDSLELNNLPALSSVTVNYCDSLKHFAVSNCPSLTTLYLSYNGFEEFSLGQEASSVTSLRLDGSPVESISLDLPNLVSLYCDYTNLKTADLSKLPALKNARLRYGVLESVTLNDTALANTLSGLYVNENNMALADIPPRGPQMQASTSYTAAYNYYAPQNPIAIDKDQYVDQTLDLSKYTYGRLYDSDSVVASTITLITKFEEELVQGTDYSVADGVYTFLKSCEDSVMVIVTNEEFDWFKTYTSSGTTYDYRLVSNYFLINDAPTGITGVEAKTGLRVSTPGRCQMTVTGADGERLAVYDLTGRMVGSQMASGQTTLTVPAPGVYIVAAGGERRKVLVK